MKEYVCPAHQIVALAPVLLVFNAILVILSATDNVLYPVQMPLMLRGLFAPLVIQLVQIVLVV
jgi:hypothetical protein